MPSEKLSNSLMFGDVFSKAENEMLDAFIVADKSFRYGDPLTDKELKVLLKVYSLQYFITRHMADENRPYEQYLIQSINRIESYIKARKAK